MTWNRWSAGFEIDVNSIPEGCIDTTYRLGLIYWIYHSNKGLGLKKDYLDSHFDFVFF